MSIINSLLVAVIMMTIVFIVLAVLSLLLKVQTSILSYFSGNKNRQENNFQITDNINLNTKTAEMSTGELELKGVDERTAAMVMAMASDELKIPLNELQFKSIKALD